MAKPSVFGLEAFRLSRFCFFFFLNFMTAF
jgi:hypothetical protein